MKLIPRLLLLACTVTSAALPTGGPRGAPYALQEAIPQVPFLDAGSGSLSELPDEGRLPSLEGATDWLNSPPLSTTALRGKVVVVDFWTYTCINWRRTLPYIRALAAKYRDHGLVVIGVHSPEFTFERDVNNVLSASREMGIEYPIAVDSDHRIWQAFGNQYWPALYIVDAQGRIRHHKFGEGTMQRRKRSSGSCSLNREPLISGPVWRTSMPVVWKSQPIGVP